MLKAAGLPPGAEWNEKKADEVMKSVGREQLAALMREHGRLDPHLITSELAALEQRLGKLEQLVGTLAKDVGMLAEEVRYGLDWAAGGTHGLHAGGCVMGGTGPQGEYMAFMQVGE